MATLVFGRNRISEVDQKLITPFLVKWLKSHNYANVETSEKLEMRAK